MAAEFGLPDENWLCLLAGKRTFTELRLFKFNDIEVEKRKDKDEFKKLVQNRFGSGTNKVLKEDFLKEVEDEHETIRKLIKKETGPVVTSFFCSLATIAGMNGTTGGSFSFRDISQNASNNVCFVQFYHSMILTFLSYQKIGIFQL